MGWQLAKVARVARIMESRKAARSQGARIRDVVQHGQQRVSRPLLRGIAHDHIEVSANDEVAVRTHVSLETANGVPRDRELRDLDAIDHARLTLADATRGDRHR